MPALKRTRLTASAWRKANWCINCVLMRVMERRERDNSKDNNVSFTAFHYPHQHTVDTPVCHQSIAPMRWNSLPNCIRTSELLSTFKAIVLKNPLL